MQENYSSTKLPTTSSTANTGHTSPTSVWQNTSNIYADDGNDATWGAYLAGQGAYIEAGGFDLPQLPDSAVIDGIAVYVDGSQIGCYGGVTLNLTDTSTKDLGTLGTTYGDATDLWGASSIDKSELSSLTVNIETNDVSGGDGIASINYLSVAIYWHIEVPNEDSEVPTRVEYKVYSREGNYLGKLPNVTSKLAFPEDINSAGTSITITCAIKADNEVTVTPLLTESGAEITTEDDLPILATSTNLLVTEGNSVDEAIFKNSNRVKAWLYNSYYPNGKLMFSGQINRISFKYGGGDATVNLTVYSDGLDLNNYVARGYPFSYTTDVTQLTYDGVYTVTESSKGAGWARYGQSWTAGASADNIGEIVLFMQGTATVTLSVYDAPNGNFLGSITKEVNAGSPASVYWDFPQLIPITPSSTYFFGVSVAAGQSIKIYRSSSNVYSGGNAYYSSYAGGSGGGLYYLSTGDMFFATKYGEPTTTATFTSDDPVADMASGVFADYNARGGLITERNFTATGLSLTYTFVVAYIYDVLKKILEMCPTGYYSYIDVGTAEIDILQTSTTADFTVVKGKHINELNIDLTIENVKNYLLFTGGEVSGSNLYRDYPDLQSVANYGLRTSTKTDNRVTLDATADAIGDTFIEENSDEVQQTSLTLLNEVIDITLLTPGKTIGFKNFGNFIDDLVLQIVRREGNYSDGTMTLTLGRLPVRMTDEVQRINRELLNEQTINNPTAPS